MCVWLRGPKTYNCFRSQCQPFPRHTLQTLCMREETREITHFTRLCTLCFYSWLYSFGGRAAIKMFSLSNRCCMPFTHHQQEWDLGHRQEKGKVESILGIEKYWIGNKQIKIIPLRPFPTCPVVSSNALSVQSQLKQWLNSLRALLLLYSLFVRFTSCWPWKWSASWYKASDAEYQNALHFERQVSGSVICIWVTGRDNFCY